ncbi:MAG: cellulase family glycosylhydrolase [Polyangiaceae bacterium]
MRARVVAGCGALVTFVASCAVGCGAANAGRPSVETGKTDSSAIPGAGFVGSGKVSAIDGGTPSGWLYTKGNKIYVSNGSSTRSGAKSGTPWMGRGVNMDDLYLCGFDNNLQMARQTPNAEDTLRKIVNELLATWHPTFVRISLGMNSWPTPASWTKNEPAYKTPMTNVIRSIGSHAGVYVLVTLRTEASMIGQDPENKEATAVPSRTANTPDATTYPNGTDSVYQALVDTFANDAFVLFGVSNEPGGNAITQEALVPAMSHAVNVIRAEEDRLGVPHHLVSVQGTRYSAKIDFYSRSPLPFDNVVYEVHGYPPAPSDYTYANIPVILGEYGSLTDAKTFYADVEAKQIPNLAWDFEPYSDCHPDLLTVNGDATNLVPSTWGTTVRNYLTTH